MTIRYRLCVDLAARDESWDQLYDSREAAERALRRLAKQYGRKIHPDGDYVDLTAAGCWPSSAKIEPEEY
jgi:hypothetical protein